MSRPTDPIDPVETASQDSFPASDPPGWIPVHTGSPVLQLLETDATARAVWNEALEQAAIQAEAGQKPGERCAVARRIRDMKCK